MNTSAIQSFRSKLAANSAVFGLWVTLESASVTEMAVALGLDWVVIDTEHGQLDWKEVVEHLRAAVRSQTVALVRLPELTLAGVKRALDLGADGVVIPMVESSEQLRQTVAFARYPPEGKRGIGAERATAWGQCLVEHTTVANDHVLVVPIIETVRGAEQTAALCGVDGVDVFFIGPADLSASAGYRGQWEGPGVAEKILTVKDTVRAAGKHSGLLATSHEDTRQRLQQGFRMIGLGQDCGLLLRSLRAALTSVGRDQPINVSLDPTRAPASAPPLDRPPETMRPDRVEVMSEAASSPKLEIAPGVVFDCLVGAHNGARNLTTGLVTFAPAARLPYHMHPFTESITLLRGQAVVEVEGRQYFLAALDNVVIPPQTAHAAWNLAPDADTVFHIAMATHQPTRALVNPFEPARKMPGSFAGLPGAERVNRYHSAPRGSAGPNTEFIDFFNRDLMPGIEMSGGFGLFHPAGRLPAHVHDFDESICIIDGTAACIVEGRRYNLSGCSTALVPRGRVHYFINDSNTPMAMLWVYAGPTPLRIIVAERCATSEGNPWQ